MYRCTKCGKDLKFKEIAAHEEFHAAEEAREAEREKVREKEEREITSVFKELSERIDKFNKTYGTSFELSLKRNNWDLPDLMLRYW